MVAVGGGVVVNSPGLGVTIGGSPAAGRAVVATSPTAASWQNVLTTIEQAITGTGGFNKINGTQAILTWNTPNDGNMHPFVVSAVEFVTALETGGQVSVTFTFGGHTTSGFVLFTGGQAAGVNFPTATAALVADPNTTVTVNQSSALTAGGPTTVFAAILGQ